MPRLTNDIFPKRILQEEIMSHDLKKLWYDIVKFFYQDEHFEQFMVIKHRRAQTEKGTKISLRMIEFLLTTYCLQTPVAYVIASNQGEKSVMLDPSEETFIKEKTKYETLTLFDLRTEYQRQIDLYHKKMFDPCCRSTSKERIVFDGPRGYRVETTLKQLLFFYWAIKHHVIDWIRLHAENIKEAMKIEEREKKTAKQRGKQRELVDPNYIYRSRKETLKRKRANKIKTQHRIQVVYQTDLETWK